MTKKEVLTKEFSIVGVNDIDISNDDYPIIGAQGLGPCISFILHNKINKRAMVGHLSLDMFLNEGNMLGIIEKIYSLLNENNLINNNFDLYLIEGTMPSRKKLYLYDYNILESTDIKSHSILELLEILIKNIKVIKVDEIIKTYPNNAFEIVDLDGNIVRSFNLEASKQFAFDSRNGEFVTKNVLFGKDYLAVHNRKKL